MGNICLHSDNKDVLLEKYCKKCCDKFIVKSGGYSQRRSCRCHYYINNICIHCHQKKVKQEETVIMLDIYNVNSHLVQYRIISV